MSKYTVEHNWGGARWYDSITGEANEDINSTAKRVAKQLIIWGASNHVPQGFRFESVAVEECDLAHAQFGKMRPQVKVTGTVVTNDGKSGKWLDGPALSVTVYVYPA